MKGISYILDCWCRFAKTPTMAESRKYEEKVPLSKVINNLNKAGKL